VNASTMHDPTGREAWPRSAILTLSGPGSAMAISSSGGAFLNVDEENDV
jgi:hypothetical protein